MFDMETQFPWRVATQFLKTVCMNSMLRMVKVKEFLHLYLGHFYWTTELHHQHFPSFGYMEEMTYVKS
jgi:hypothetical protein